MANACAFYTCGCLDNECSGGGCPSLGDGCTDQMRSDCAAFACGCAGNQCSGGACPPLAPSQDLPTATQFNVATERAALLDGVSSPVRIGVSSVPGGIAMFDAQSFPVLLSDQMPVVAASRSHSGRAVAFGHPDFFDRTVLTNLANASTARLVENAARWAAAGKPTPHVGVIAGANDGLVGLLSPTMTVRTLASPITASSLAGLDVVTFIANTPRSESEIQALESFNINGGGLLVAGLGWSWMISPMTELREMPGNRVLARTYLGYTEASRDPAAIPVQASPPSISNAVHAYNHLRAAAPPTSATGIADIRRIQGYVRDVIPLLTLPSKLKAALQQLMQATKDVYPSAATPLDPVDRPFQTLGLMYAARRPFEPAQVQAHPAASDFPGAVAASAPRVDKYVAIDTRVPGWHSTELYAAPGQLLGLLVPQQAIGGGLRLRIGAHTGARRLCARDGPHPDQQRGRGAALPARCHDR